MPIVVDTSAAPEPKATSPLDIAGIQLDRPITRDEILAAIQESRRR